MEKPLSNNALQPHMLSIGIVGGGSIGVSFALVFAQHQQHVYLFDPSPERRAVIMNELRVRIADLQKFHLIDLAQETILEHIHLVEDLSKAVVDRDLVIECAPESLAIKQPIFKELDALAAKETILASASSAISASLFAEGLAGKARCIVVHPGNPPHLIPIIEVVPTLTTDPEITQKTLAIFAALGKKPVLLNKEVEGFVFNRLQGAVLREAYCLVRDGVASVADIDRVMTEGVGLRWSVIGPFETADLNTRGGIASHALKMGPAYARMGRERGQNDPWTEDLVAQVETQRRQILPLEDWEKRVKWRDEAIMKLLHLRKTHK